MRRRCSNYSTILTLCFILHGCAAVFSNPSNPTYLDSCEWWPATIDIAMLIAAGTTLNIIDQTNVIEDPIDEYAILGAGTMYTLVFLMSAMTGYAEYARCQGYLPILQENIQTLKNPYNWIGDR